MKLCAILTSLIFSNIIFASSVLNNCFSAQKAQFFVNKLEEIATEKSTPVFLLNGENETVGVISVNVSRSPQYPYNASNVDVNELSLCSSLEVNAFYYTDDNASNLLKWSNSPSVSITQDEGMIVLSTSLVRKESYASFYKVTFRVYDVFTEVNESQRDLPDFIEDWGLPKGRGEFYFIIPNNWVTNN